MENPSTARLPSPGFDTGKLLAPAQALIAYFARVGTELPDIELVALDDALGRVLAREIACDADYPAGARSSMDGFALDATHTPGQFECVGDVRMGSAERGRVPPGMAVRIPTGGLLPAGTNAVVPIEDVTLSANRVGVGTVPVGDCVTPKGADMRCGEVLLRPGRRIGGAEAALLATFGIVRVPVYRRPLFGVVSSGDELVDASQIPGGGQLRDSNRWAVAGTLGALGASVRHFPIVADDAGELRRTLAAALEMCDGVVMTGGSSVGERDFTPSVVASLGDPGLIVHGLRVKPGKPTVLGAVGRKPVIGLPGNPASALLILEAVAAPIVSALVGAPLRARTSRAVLSESYEKRAGWTWFVPVAVEEQSDPPRAVPLPMRSSSVSLAVRAAGYVILAEDVASVPAGTEVTVTHFLSGGMECRS